MAPTRNNYSLQWKGRQSGPFTMDEIQAKLRENEIGLMHLVSVGGQWVTLADFFAGEKAQGEAQQAQESRSREQDIRSQEQQARLAADYEERLAGEQAKQDDLQRRLNNLERQVSRPDRNAANPRELPQRYDEVYSPSDRRSSGLAITSLIMGLLNFVPGVNFVSWILAIIFGHIALSQIKRDPNLVGRGMAIAGLVITYVLLAIGLGIGIVFGIIASSKGHF